jgi:hypothetical protein
MMASNDEGSVLTLIREEAMHNHCAYCHGKFGLVRHRRPSKSFCSRKCVDQHRIRLQTQRAKGKGWFDCLWAASLNVIPYAGVQTAA